MFSFRESIWWIKEKINPVKSIPLDKLYEEMTYKINNGIPFITSRIGGAELFAIRTAEFNYARKEEAFSTLCRVSGFYPVDDINENIFLKEMIKAIGVSDYFWRCNKFKDYYFVKKYGSDYIRYTGCYGVEFAKDSWTQALNDKKVLVISPFTKSIQSQYERFDKVHNRSESEYIPKFELITLTAVQTIGGGSSRRLKQLV